MMLAKLDSNDDELVGPGELVAQSTYPGALGPVLLKATSSRGESESHARLFSIIVPTAGSDDTLWMKTVVAAREAAEREHATPEPPGTNRTSAPAAVWHIRLGEKTTSHSVLEADGYKRPPADGRLRLSSASMQLELRNDDGKIQEQLSASQKRFSALFAESDNNVDHTLDAAELATPKSLLLRQLATIADRDGDGRLSEQECADWFNLQGQIAKGSVLITLVDHGAGLFELLDADHDGSLSQRELRYGWNRIQTAQCVENDQFSRPNLPRQFRATISQGRPQTMMSKPMRRGPDWFQAMDRNGDGDVSRREFSGKPDIFIGFDRDRDELISSNEASKTQ